MAFTKAQQVLLDKLASGVELAVQYEEAGEPTQPYLSDGSKVGTNTVQALWREGVLVSHDKNKHKNKLVVASAREAEGVKRAAIREEMKLRIVDDAEPAPKHTAAHDAVVRLIQAAHADPVPQTRAELSAHLRVGMMRERLKTPAPPAQMSAAIDAFRMKLMNAAKLKRTKTFAMEGPGFMVQNSNATGPMTPNNTRHIGRGFPDYKLREALVKDTYDAWAAKKRAELTKAGAVFQEIGV